MKVGFAYPTLSRHGEAVARPQREFSGKGGGREEGRGKEKRGRKKRKRKKRERGK